VLVLGLTHAQECGTRNFQNTTDQNPNHTLINVYYMQQVCILQNTVF